MSKKLLFAGILTALQLIALFSTSSVQSVDSTPTVLLNPEIVSAKVGSTFAVDIVVGNVTDLGGWLVSMSWDPKVIQITTGDPAGVQLASDYFDVYEGPFLRNQAATYFVIDTLDNGEGRIVFGALFKSSGIGVTGSGVVATLNFTVLDFGFTPLEIFDSVLADKFNAPIQHDTENSTICVFSLCVDGSNSLGPWDGSLEHPYQNITSALQNASENDTIFVREGTYYENFTIDKAVTLVGENEDTTVIDGGGVGTIVTVAANYANISRLTIRNGYYVPHVTYGVEILGCNDVTISDSTISDNDVGIFLYYANESTITGNSIFSNWRGIAMTFASSDKVFNNTIFGSEEDGISMGMDANDNVVSNNNVCNNSLDGIEVGWSSGNYVAGNELTYNNEAGVRLDAADNNAIAGNTISFDNRDGIVLYGSNFNTIDANGLIGNDWNGIATWYSNSNVIYHNNFINNTIQATSEAGSRNFWDNNYPSGGNFWSDLATTDLYSGIYQNESSSDGICDSQRPIDGNNSDHYPLVAPFTSFNVISNDTEYQIDVESNSNISELSFDNTDGSLNFNATGQGGTIGFCRMTVPKSLEEPTETERWASTIDNYLPLSSNIAQDADNTYLFISYEQSMHNITIKIIEGNEVVIGFEPQAITVQKNETFSVNLTIGNIPSDPGMAGIEFVVVWNSSFLNGVNMTDVVFHTSTPQSEQDNIWGIENIVNTSYAFYAYTWHDLYRAQENGYSSISGNQTVATITLKAIATGNTSLSVYVVEISSAEQERLVYVNPTWPVPEKSDLNFYLVDCEVKIKTMKADINGDGVVDIFDALLMAKSFGSVRNDSNWNPDCDLNNDGVIDIFDVILLARNFGKTVPP